MGFFFFNGFSKHRNPTVASFRLAQVTFKLELGGQACATTFVATVLVFVTVEIGGGIASTSRDFLDVFYDEMLS